MYCLVDFVNLPICSLIFIRLLDCLAEAALAICSMKNLFVLIHSKLIALETHVTTSTKMLLEVLIL